MIVALTVAAGLSVLVFILLDPAPSPGSALRDDIPDIPSLSEAPWRTDEDAEL